ncbi:MAG: alpha-amylase [Planctomycetes bacterium]|nr:alpha-amylase [Planctomycetota bacterium]
MRKPKTHPDASMDSPTYRIPKLWNCWGYAGEVGVDGSECVVDARRYFSRLLLWVREQSSLSGRVRGRNLSRIQGIECASSGKVLDRGRSRRGGDWIRRCVVYSAHARSCTAWDHDGSGRLGTKPFNDLGTFCKTILILPHLKRLGVNALYLLPITKVSRAHRKGELGCPYATQNFFEFDPSQADPVLGEQVGDINAQFHLLVDCAHRLGIRVLIDIAPRTVARDNDWILQHPEWFYWIDKRADSRFRPPIIEGVERSSAVPGRSADIYNLATIDEHLGKFRFAPNITHPDAWKSFVYRENRESRRGLLQRIQEEFGVTTSPGFTDVINDPQPLWNDVTYLRMFADHPVESKKHLPDPNHQPPYVHFDTIKSSHFPGAKPHTNLWKKLASIIPFYQRFGIDGARIDMAHALPGQLQQKMLEEPRKKDPDFCFIAEELGTENHARARRAGYNLLIGPSWWMQPRAQDGELHRMVDETQSLRLPVFATAENADTPRAPTRVGKRKFATQMAVLNCFLPNAVPMINSGSEVYERQPSNIGLDAKSTDRFALPKSDPYFGKLAFFDKTILHWANRGGENMVKTIAKATRIRREFIDALTRPAAYIQPKVEVNPTRILAVAYRLNTAGDVLLVIANLDCKHKRKTRICGIRNIGAEYDILMHLGQGDPAISIHRSHVTAQLQPGGCLIVKIKAQRAARSTRKR